MFHYTRKGVLPLMIHSHFNNTVPLKKKLGRELSYIRSVYRDMLSKGKRDENSEWLSDNYYILEKEGRSLIKEFGRRFFLPCESGHEPVVYLEMLDFLEKNGSVVTSESLKSHIECRQQKKYYQSCELYSLSAMLRAGLLHGAFLALQKGDGLGHVIKSLRGINSIDFEEIHQSYMAVQRILEQDPAGVYLHMDEQSKAAYIEKIAKMARREGIDELTVAKNILNVCQNAKDDTRRHIGFYIMEDDAERKSRMRAGKISLACALILPVLMGIFFAVVTEIWWLGILLIFPCGDIVKTLCEYFSVRRTKPEWLPRMELDGAVPEEAETVIVVSNLIGSPDKEQAATKRLEQLLYTNGRGEVLICLLADLKQGEYPSMPEDAAVIRSVARQVEALNRKHGSKFVLLVRKRVYSKTQNAYMGWERKRGAITELVRIIKGEEVALEARSGPVAALKKVKYLICLDSDTQLLMDTVPRMVGAALHPLNQPVIANGAVRSGYGIIAPRMSTDLVSTGHSAFSRMMAGARGISVYDAFSSDYYMDIFKEGIFAGKGLIDVQSFYELMNYCLPEEQILSHDSLESGFLRTAYMSDVEMADGFPSSLISCQKRRHRWLRGDVQNASYCRSEALNSLTRYKLFDNIRRAVSPFMSLFLMIAALCFTSGPSNLAAFLVILSLCGSQLFSALMTIIHGGPDMLSRKYYSKVLPDALLNLSQAVMALVMFTDSALKDLDAVFRAWYRKTISKKNLLEWVTAADSEKGGGAGAALKSHGLATLISAFLLYFSTGSLAKLVFFCSLLVIPVSYYTARKNQRNKIKFSPEVKEELLGYAAAMCSYYEDLFCKEDHYLPPDNLQESPVMSIAHRTSPTNIGLMLLGFLSARDFGFIDTPTLIDRIEKSTTAIERLEKWNGNLLNWYDLRTLAPLRPRYVSTVDSGNFVSNLVVLVNGLKEYGAPEALLKRLETLIENTDLTPFYNKNRKLFHIGYDLEEEALSESYYDLLMSESRITSYYAIATRQIPKKHWGSLGRTLARQGGFTGPVSWTGTMFEYFMPALFLPVPEGSLSYEALKFCHYCQRRRVHPSIPYGISESGFYAFDPQLHYQYKAHGVQKIGLKRGLDSELVVSPYSSFLAMPMALEAFYNLKRLEKLNMIGRYGFYEAIDYTKSRVKGHPKIIKSYMAHHVGMSLLAVNNILNDDIIKKRFISDSRMSCAKELLEEKIPGGAVVFEDIAAPEIPDKTARRHAETEEYEDVNPLMPRMSLLSNGEMTTLMTDVGAGMSTYRSLDLTRRSTDLLRNPMGIFALIKQQDTVFSLTSAPLYDSTVHHRVEFGSGFLAYYAQKNGIEGGMMVSLHKEIACEQRKLLVKNRVNKKQTAQILFYMEPILTKTASEAAHPAFAKLFVESFEDKVSRSVIFKRRIRDGEEPVFLCVGFREEVSFAYETNREKVLDNPDGLTSLPKAFDKKFTGCSTAHDHCLALQTSMILPPKGQKELTLLVCAAPTEEEAVRRLVLCRRDNLTVTTSAKSPLSDLSLEARLMQTLLPYLHYPLRESKETLAALRENTLGQNALWSMGISGDNPLVLLEIYNAADAARAEGYIKALLRLRICFVRLDLAIVFREGGAYGQPQTSALDDVVKKSGCESLIDVNGGVHLIDLVTAPPYSLNLLQASACFIAGADMTKARPVLQTYTPLEILPVQTTEPTKGYTVHRGVFHDQSFFVTQKPDVPWCHVLANKTFGTLVSHEALGYTWAINARENKLTPWSNDTRTDNQGEMLLLHINKKYYNLCQGALAEFSPSYAKYHSMVEGLRVVITVTVPAHGMRKRVEAAIDNGGEAIDYRLIYYTEPILGCGASTARYLCAKWEKGALIFRNSRNTAVKGVMVITAHGGGDECICDRGAFLSGRLNQNTLSPLIDNCGAIVLRRQIEPGETKYDAFTMSFGVTEEAALHEAHSQNGAAKKDLNRIHIHTPDKALDHMVNHFLPHQIVKGRMMSRTAFYQCSGAYGFRDQLQDSGAAVLLDSSLTKQQIMRACAHQFLEGDVLHWWHTLPKSGGGDKGVRTRYSDDLLWLPLTVAEYVVKTGDKDILSAEVHYIEAPELQEHEHEVYMNAVRSPVKESVYKHCLRALERVSLGEHGLPLMGGGDWCDGYNKVGEKGLGESVWVAMFLSMVQEQFAPLCTMMEEPEQGESLCHKAQELRENIDRHAYDGDWYLRAFYDNGEKMGGAESAECSIDSLTQSFSVLCGMPDAGRVQSAMESALSRLVDYKNGLIKLFDPPFSESANPVGYVISYPKGVRENGGQYTHGILWLVMAVLRMGDTDKAYKLLSMLNPAQKCADPAMAEIYTAEPYYIAADVYTNPRETGRGGWSIYTGAAGWFYRIAVEELLGIRLLGGRVEIAPRLPSHWDKITLDLTIEGTKIHVTARQNAKPVTVPLDGQSHRVEM